MNISFGDGLVYPVQSQHLSTVYETLNDSPSTIDIEGSHKSAMESRPLETVLIDVAEHTTQNS